MLSGLFLWNYEFRLRRAIRRRLRSVRVEYLEYDDDGISFWYCMEDPFTDRLRMTCWDVLLGLKPICAAGSVTEEDMRRYAARLVRRCRLRLSEDAARQLDAAFSPEAWDHAFISAVWDIPFDPNTDTETFDRIRAGMEEVFHRSSGRMRLAGEIGARLRAGN